MAQVVPRLDSATAAHVLGEPLRIAAWARLLHERAGLLRMAGDEEGASLVSRRARELAAEAQGRSLGYEKAVRELLGALAEAAGPA